MSLLYTCKKNPLAVFFGFKLANGLRARQLRGVRGRLVVTRLSVGTEIVGHHGRLHHSTPPCPTCGPHDSERRTRTQVLGPWPCPTAVSDPLPPHCPAPRGTPFDFPGPALVPVQAVSGWSRLFLRDQPTRCESGTLGTPGFLRHRKRGKRKRGQEVGSRRPPQPGNHLEDRPAEPPLQVQRRV